MTIKATHMGARVVKPQCPPVPSSEITSGASTAPSIRATIGRASAAPSLSPGRGSVEQKQKGDAHEGGLAQQFDKGVARLAQQQQG